MSLVINVFKEIVSPGSSGDNDARRKVKLTLEYPGVAEVLAKIEDAGVRNLATAALTLAEEVDEGDVPKTINEAVLNSSLGGELQEFVRGYTPLELVEFGFSQEEVSGLVSILTAAGIFDSKEQDLTPAVIELFGDVLKFIQPSLTERRKSLLSDG